MDNAPLDKADSTQDDITSDSDNDSIAYALENMPVTPTKRSRIPLQMSGSLDYARTPRPSKPGSSLMKEDASYTGPDSSMPTLGFTLSYLRRVPELCELAWRVVKAEARRREEANQAQGQGTSTASKARQKPPSRAKEGPAPKIKRLFVWAVLKLYEEGSIVLWDGPTRPVRDRNDADTSGLWRASTSTRSAVTSLSLSRARLADGEGWDDRGEISDPPPDEESYVPLTPAYLARQVEASVRALTTPRVAKAQVLSRRHALRPRAPTKEDVLRHLRRSDGRWERVGLWALTEALEWLQSEGRAWCVSDDAGGRWELCS
jgi:hypothetical protein